MREGVETRTIDTDRLRGRPDNANHMPEPLFNKLVERIRESGRYPAIIVRPHPEEPDAFEILDGHHRVEALRRLGHSIVHCDVWPVDDDEALVLLTTLNRLEGRDDPLRRADLVARLAERFGRERIAAILPEDRAGVERLMALRLPPPSPRPAPSLDAMPEAVTFFLTAAQRRALDALLRDYEGSRSQRLVAMLGLDGFNGS